jgi:hypothetical protein
LAQLELGELGKVGLQAVSAWKNGWIGPRWVTNTAEKPSFVKCFG